MKAVFEFRWDSETFGLALGETIHKEFLAGHRIIWNHKGMRGVIPPAILESHYDLLAAYQSRLRDYDVAPPDVGRLRWECVVRVPAPDHPVSHPTDEDA